MSIPPAYFLNSPENKSHASASPLTRPGALAAGLDVSLLPLIPSHNDITDLQSYLRGPKELKAGSSRKRRQEAQQRFVSQMNQERLRQSTFALRSNLTRDSRSAGSEYNPSSTNSLIYSEQPHSFSTPSLIRSTTASPPLINRTETPVPMTQRLGSPPPAVHDEPSTSSRGWIGRMRRSRSASNLSTRKLTPKNKSAQTAHAAHMRSAQGSPVPGSRVQTPVKMGTGETIPGDGSIGAAPSVLSMDLSLSPISTHQLPMGVDSGALSSSPGHPHSSTRQNTLPVPYDGDFDAPHCASSGSMYPYEMSSFDEAHAQFDHKRHSPLASGMQASRFNQNGKSSHTLQRDPMHPNALQPDDVSQAPLDSPPIQTSPSDPFLFNKRYTSSSSELNYVYQTPTKPRCVKLPTVPRVVHVDPREQSARPLNEPSEINRSGHSMSELNASEEPLHTDMSQVSSLSPSTKNEAVSRPLPRPLPKPLPQPVPQPVVLSQPLLPAVPLSQSQPQPQPPSPPQTTLLEKELPPVTDETAQSVSPQVESPEADLSLATPAIEEDPISDFEQTPKTRQQPFTASETNASFNYQDTAHSLPIDSTALISLQGGITPRVGSSEHKLPPVNTDIDDMLLTALNVASVSRSDSLRNSFPLPRRCSASNDTSSSRNSNQSDMERVPEEGPREEEDDFITFQGMRLAGDELVMHHKLNGDESSSQQHAFVVSRNGEGIGEPHEHEQQDTSVHESLSDVSPEQDVFATLQEREEYALSPTLAPSTVEGAVGSMASHIEQFQAQQASLRGTIESSKAEIVHLRERIRAFRSEVNGDVDLQLPDAQLSDQMLSQLTPESRQRLRDSLASMDDLDRRLSDMLASHATAL